MSDYTHVHEELGRGTAPELLCATCPWDRLCVTPPAMSPQDVERQLTKAQAKDKAEDPAGVKVPARALMTFMIYAGRDTMADMCPVFALRLRSPDGRGLADGIRGLMRGDGPA